MTAFNIYRVRFVQSQRYAINISAPSAELAEFFAEEICSANTPDLLAAVTNALDQLRRGGPRWTIEESLANALARAKAQGDLS